MLPRALRRPLAIGALAATLAWSGAAAAEPFLDMSNLISRPITLPAHKLGVFLGGGARHFEDGDVLSTSGLGGGYGITDHFMIQASLLNVEYTPTTRLLGPGASATYAFFDRGVQAGIQLRVGGVFVPSPGAVVSASLPIRIPVSERARIDFQPEMPVLMTSRPAIGLIVPFGLTVRIFPFLYARYDTAAQVLDVRARTLTVPMRLTVSLAAHVKSIPLNISPSFAFPQLITPGDELPHVHTKDFSLSLGVATWYQL